MYMKYQVTCTNTVCREKKMDTRQETYSSSLSISAEAGTGAGRLELDAAGRRAVDDSRIR